MTEYLNKYATVLMHVWHKLHTLGNEGASFVVLFLLYCVEHI